MEIEEKPGFENPACSLQDRTDPMIEGDIKSAAVVSFCGRKIRY
jgi:hypothetical protein